MTNENESMSYTARIREVRWEKIEKKAWKLSQEANRFVKPTDVLDAILFKYTDQISLNDIDDAKDHRK